MTILKQPLSKLRAKSVSGPRVLIVVASVATILITLVEMFRGALTVGISTDERLSVSLLEQALNGTWDPDGTFGVRPESIAFAKGNTFQLLAHLANVIRGNESWANPSYSAESYAVQHLLVSCVAVVALSAVGVSAWLLTRVFTIGLFATAALSAIPVFIGHAMFNSVDVPSAAGFSLLTAGCLMLLNPPPMLQTKGKVVNLLAFVAIVLGFWLGAGVRFVLWLPFLVITLITGCFLSLSRRVSTAAESSDSSIRDSGIWVAPSAAIVGMLFIGLSHVHYLPYAGAWMTKSLLNAANHRWGSEIGTQTFGQLMLGGSLEWWYLPAWIGASMPLLLGALVILGTVFGAVQVLGRKSGLLPRASYGLVLLQAYALSLATLVSGAVMYNAQRHNLFIYPAFAVLGGVGLNWLLNHSENRWARTNRFFSSWAIALVAGLALLYPTIERLRLYPYEYTYLNEVATIGGINGRWETEYFNVSLREALSRIPFQVYPSFHGPDDNYLAFLHLWGSSYDAKNNASAREFWRINTTLAGRVLPPNCRDVDSVTRNFRGEDVVMSWVGICKR